MNKTLWILLIALFYCEIKAEQKKSNDEFYIAGAVEFGHPDTNIEREKSPAEYVKNNVKSYLHFIDLAKDQNVDILVFPEATLNYFSERTTMIENAFAIPDPSQKIAPWQGGNFSEHLKTISRKCKEKQIYVLVNVVEKIPCSESNSCKNPSKSQGFNLYNTNIVFDREGRVISKYQKYNLFIEPNIEQPVTLQHSTFETDFGVKFGHFICFDIMFKEPAMSLLQHENVTNILFPSMWFSDLPFLTSNQFHQSWAYTNNINLISAGANNPSFGSSGSGIFVGKQKISKSFISPYITQKLLVSSVPKVPQNLFSTTTLSKQKERFTPVEMQKLSLSEYWAGKKMHTEEILNQPQSICLDDDICCYFDIKMKNLNIPEGKIAYNYKLVANYTTSVFGLTRKCGELYCAVVSCKTDNPDSCGRRFKNNINLINAVEFEKISIKAKIKYNQPNDLLVAPTTLDTSILPLELFEYDFKHIKTYKEKGYSFKEFQIESNTKIENLLTFGIYGRNFALDEILPNGN